MQNRKPSYRENRSEGRTTGFFRTLFRRGFSPKEYMGNYICAGLINTRFSGVWVLPRP